MCGKTGDAIRQQMTDLLEKQEAAAAAPMTVVVRNFSGSGADPVNDWIDDERAVMGTLGTGRHRSGRLPDIPSRRANTTRNQMSTT